MAESSFWTVVGYRDLWLQVINYFYLVDTRNEPGANISTLIQQGTRAQVQVIQEKGMDFP